MHDKFWFLPLSTLIEQLTTNSKGLTQLEAQKRKTQYGANTIAKKQKKALILQFLSRFRNPFIVLLLIASGLSAFVEDIYSAIIIVTMVLISAILDFFQEHRAEQSAEKLQQAIAHQSTVLRNGKTQEILSEDLVPGDIVILTGGDLIPADGRLIFAKDLFVNQALLTGESFPIEKNAEDLKNPSQDLTEASNALFMGSSILTGEGHMVVCKTGEETFLGKIADVLKKAPMPTAFELGTKRFGYFLIHITVFLSFFVLIVNLLFQRPLMETILFSLALTVGMTPEFFPMIISISLARGSMRMAEKKVIVKRLSAIHDLGSMDILCTDKTGTLTESKIQLAGYVDYSGQPNEKVLELGYLNSYFETGIKSQLDTAILNYKEMQVKNWSKIDEKPFDFERCKVSVLLNDGTANILIVKGAPEEILKDCSQYAAHEKIEKLDEDVKSKIETLFTELSKQGLRILSIAWKAETTDHLNVLSTDENNMVFAGFLTFFDPPKKSAKEMLQLLSDNHVQLKILSGDNEHVTAHLCSELGIPIQGILKGEEISKMSPSALQVNAEKANLFCRVNPSQKTRIIEALKLRGHVVGFMGDGINDAPSLHRADVGISIDTAVDVAKEAADFILLEQNLNVVNDGIIEGRRTYANIMKYIMMVTSSNFGNMFSMAGASLFIPFLPMRAIQILLNSFLYDMSEIPIPLDNVDQDILRKPHKWSMNFIGKFMIILGPISSIFDFIVFYLMLHFFRSDEALFQTGWFISSLATQILVIFIIRTKLSPLKGHPHPILTIFSLFLVIIGITIPITPLGKYFGFVYPPLSFFLILPVIVISYLCVAELGKRFFYRYLINNSKSS